MVLLPEVIEAIDGAVPVLAASGIVTGGRTRPSRWAPTALGRDRYG